jgi:hypothetical protein
MNGDWRLIGRGLAISMAGAAASMLAVVAASAAFVGSYATTIGSIVVASILGVVFHRTLTPFLDALDRRSSALSGNHDLITNSEREASGPGRLNDPPDQQSVQGD